MITSTRTDPASPARLPSEGPGGENFDSAFVFAHAALQKVCAELLYSQLSRRKGLFLLTGDAGTGKSVLLASLARRPGIGDRSVLLRAREDMTFDSLVAAWCAHLAAPRDGADPEAGFHALVASLNAQAEQGAPSILLLDSAEDLSDDALRRLARLAALESGWGGLVQIILAGRPEIGQRLEAPELTAGHDVIAYRSRLDPLSAQESGRYLQHCLRAAGFAGPALLSADAIEQVIRHARGNFRLIDILCRATMAIARREGRGNVSAETVARAARQCAAEMARARAGERPPETPDTPPRGAGAAAFRRETPGPGPTPDPGWPLLFEPEPSSPAGPPGAAAMRRGAGRGALIGTAALLLGLIVGGGGMLAFQALTDTLDGQLATLELSLYEGAGAASQGLTAGRVDRPPETAAPVEEFGAAFWRDLRARGPVGGRANLGTLPVAPEPAPEDPERGFFSKVLDFGHALLPEAKVGDPRPNPHTKGEHR